MLIKDFFFSFKNINLNLIEKGKKLKTITTSISVLYKFLILDSLFYNFFYKKNLDGKNKELFDKDLNHLFRFFNSYKIEHEYSKIYEKYFENFRNEEVNILEIGIAKGDGLASFFYYFPNSKLIGLDNNPFRIRYKSNRIRHIFTDISSKKILSNLSKHINEKFDIIIEDCSHKLIDQILCFSHMFYKLKDGGYYIVEDLNFPEINKIHNPTNEDLNLKNILKKIKNNENIKSKFMDSNQYDYIKNNVESINFEKGKGDFSEIVFIKKKLSNNYV